MDSLAGYILPAVQDVDSPLNGRFFMHAYASGAEASSLSIINLHGLGLVTESVPQPLPNIPAAFTSMLQLNGRCLFLPVLERLRSRRTIC